VDNLIGKAREDSTVNPIPFRDLDGLVVFNREELLGPGKQNNPANKRKPRKYAMLPHAPI